MYPSDAKYTKDHEWIRIAGAEVVSMTSLVGIVPHWRAGRVRVGAGVAFGLAGIGGSLLGTRINRSLDPDVLLLGFSMLMLVAAAAMWRNAQRRARAQAGAGEPADPVRHTANRAATVAKVLAAGTLVGLLTGLFGVGGGFVIVPALVLALGFAMPQAVGTSLLVIIINSMMALAARWGGGGIEWDVIAPFAIASLAGVLVGSRIAGRSDSTTLQRWFVGLMVAVAVYTAVRSAIALW